MRVAYQAGVLAALEQAGLRFHHVDGASGGTMNLSMLLGGQGSEEIGNRWRTRDPRGFSALLPWRDYVRSPRWPALGSGRGLREKVFPHLGIDPDRIRRATGIAGTYNVCNFATKTAEVVAHTDVDLDLLVAAVSLPALMPAVVRRGTPYTDAVWIRDSNIPEAVSRGSGEVWLVWCIGNTPTYHNGLFRQYVHMIEMAANGSLLRDLAYVGARWPHRPVRVHVIKPQQWGVAVLDPGAGLTLQLRWRTAAGHQSLLAAPVAGGHALAVTIQDDEDRRTAGTGMVPFGWRQAARALASVHATDATSSMQAARRRTALAAALACAARRSTAASPGRPATTAAPATAAPATDRR
jgi:predicted acylesterase/phospholipase RssA